MGRLFIQAANVHQGGGKALLDALMRLKAIDGQRVFLVDSRLAPVIEVSESVLVRRIPPNVIDRLKAEFWLSRAVKPDDTLLCFGNMPPLFFSRGHVVTFVQNKYLLENVALANFSWKTRMRIRVERRWFDAKAKYVNEFVVQTPTMKDALVKRLRQHGRISELDMPKISIKAFLATPDGYRRQLLATPLAKNNPYIVYVGSGEPHKNHRNLIEAWCLLAEQEIFPRLVVTLNPNSFPELCALIEQRKMDVGVRIDNVGVVDSEVVQSLYHNADALICPSDFESLGLPLIEARQAGLPVLAPELDYVRDVLDPDQTFNPASPRSIARAVKRFLGTAEDPLDLTDACGFISHLLSEGS